jgi:hypothetical protein
VKRILSLAGAAAIASIPLVIVVLGAALLPLVSSGKAAAAPTMKQKLAHIEANGRLTHPDPMPTVITEDEANAYLASDEVQLPAGVQSVKLRGQSGTIDGTAQIDFDKVREGTHSSNPLLSIFSGVHEVEVATHAYGKGGQGYVHVDSVSIDGVEVPQFVLQLFVDKYLAPRYPQIGLDSQFKLADRIDSATVGEHRVTIVQK